MISLREARREGTRSPLAASCLLRRLTGASLSSYVAALELRIEKLERRLNYARSTNASIALNGPDEPPAADPNRKDSLAFIRAAIHRKAAQNQENADINALVSDFGYL